MIKTMYMYLDSNTAHTTSNQLIRWNINNFATRTRSIISIQLLSVQFPNSVYPINTYNKSITVKQSGVSETSSLTSGIYSGSTMASHLKTVLDAMSFAQTYTVTYNTAQQNLTITPSAGTFAISVGSVNDVAYNLGVSDAQSGVESAAFTTTNPLNIGGTVYVDVHSNLGIDHISSTSSGRLLCRIPVEVDFGEIVTWQPPVPMIYRVDGSSLDYFEVRLYDDQGNPFVPPYENSNINFVFLISYQ